MADDYLKKRVTIYQVAKESGYSLATVSRVINDKENVTPETKKRVNDIIERLGYKPSAIAQGLAKSKTTTIGIVIPSHFHTYVSTMLSGMVYIAKIYGYQTVLFVTSSIEEEVSETLEKVISSNVDGAIIFDDQLSDEDIQRLESYSIPTAVIGREIENEELASIPLNYEKALRKAIQEYLANNHEPIYVLAQDKPGAIMVRAIEVIQDEARKANAKNLVNTIVVEDSYSNTYNQFLDYFKNKAIKGLFIGEIDSISCGVANAALEMGYKIPDDVQIMSIIGTKHSKMARPSLTSLDIDLYEVGSIAMRMLTKLLKNDLKIRTYPFEASIQQRESTK